MLRVSLIGNGAGVVPTLGEGYIRDIYLLPDMRETIAKWETRLASLLATEAERQAQAA